MEFIRTVGLMFMMMVVFMLCALLCFTLLPIWLASDHFLFCVRCNYSLMPQHAPLKLGIDEYLYPSTLCGRTYWPASFLNVGSDNLNCSVLRMKPRDSFLWHTLYVQTVVLGVFVLRVHSWDWVDLRRCWGWRWTVLYLGAVYTLCIVCYYLLKLMRWFVSIVTVVLHRMSNSLAP